MLRALNTRWPGCYPEPTGESDRGFEPDCDWQDPSLQKCVQWSELGNWQWWRQTCWEVRSAHTLAGTGNEEGRENAAAEKPSPQNHPHPSLKSSLTMH